MNKRILCLLLSAIMLLSTVLTGCSKKTDDEAMENVTETASESTMTLTMYLMSESEVS
jgi:outer membrane PBP1 activator LpoA protein